MEKEIVIDNKEEEQPVSIDTIDDNDTMIL